MKVVRCVLKPGRTQPPKRYNEAALLSQMEKHGLGTPRLGLISSRSWLARIRSNGKGKPSIRQAKASS